METWRLYTYDVWGNSDDGYEVNEIFRTADTVSLPTDDPSGTALGPNELHAFMQGVGLLPSPVSFYAFDLSQDDTIYIERSSNGKPLGELRRESEVAK